MLDKLSRADGHGQGGSRGVMTKREKSKKAQRTNGNAEPKLISIDIALSDNPQAPERNDTLNTAGFSDAMFNVVNSFLPNDNTRFLREVENIEL
ncbi:MAG: hypothetical protein F9B45_00095 [Phycisphaera sp. RhM]|nr:hypothetical protein [Phycisphaera sp. RhM]